jgi:hypothetical protein
MNGIYPWTQKSSEFKADLCKLIQYILHLWNTQVALHLSSVARGLDERQADEQLAKLKDVCFLAQGS